MIVLWFGIRIGGVEGAAWAWTARVFADSFLLFWSAKVGRNLIAHLSSASVLIAMALVATRLLNGGFAIRLLVALIVAGFGVAWSCIAAPHQTRRLIRASILAANYPRPLVQLHSELMSTMTSFAARFETLHSRAAHLPPAGAIIAALLIGCRMLSLLPPKWVSSHSY